MAVLALAFEADKLVLGQRLKAGKTHTVRAAVTNVQGALDYVMEIVAPRSVAETILSDIDARYDATVSDQHWSHDGWIGQVHLNNMERIEAIPIFAALKPIQPTITRALVKFQSGHGTIRIESTASAESLQQFAAHLEAAAGAIGQQLTTLVRSEMSTSAEWEGLLVATTMP